MITKEFIIQLISATVGTFGFGMIFGLKLKYLITVTFGGFLSCGIYLSGMYLLDGNIFFATLLAGAFAALYSEISARIMKAPSTLFFVTTIISLVPGRALYYTCSSAVLRDWAGCKSNANITLQYALAIAAGACIIWAIMLTIENVKKLKK
ncbi:MAG: threonine/serine exporter family protein [Clostridia bacterium]|nr:threonine/serine exporter family protein [Clostridia bacterium]